MKRRRFERLLLGVTGSAAVLVTMIAGSACEGVAGIKDTAEFAQHAYIKASNTDTDDHFGWSVALNGDTLVVGAWGEGSAATGINGNPADNGAIDSGAVYVFRRIDADWQQEAYLKASNTGMGDAFGWSVALEDDILAVGAYGEDSAATGIDGEPADNGAIDSGAVYVFRRSGTNWQQEAYLKASNTNAHDRFGYSVALDGDTLAVGAPLEDSTSPIVANSGAVYVFRRSGTEWRQEAYLKASNTGSSDVFGSSVALDGNTLAVGAPREDSTDESLEDSGAVYVFRRSGTNWQQEAYVKASNADSSDEFGCSVALDGETLAVGAYLEGSAATGVNNDQSDNSASRSGAVYVFGHRGTEWQQEAYLKASNTNAHDRFGYSMALDGETLAVGAYLQGRSRRYSGAAYLFRRSGAEWQQAGDIKSSNPNVSDWFGYSVTLDNGTLAVGAHAEDSAARGLDGSQDDNSASDSGAVYVFQ